jgi:hypothetical protein
VGRVWRGDQCCRVDSLGTFPLQPFGHVGAEFEVAGIKKSKSFHSRVCRHHTGLESTTGLATRADSAQIEVSVLCGGGLLLSPIQSDFHVCALRLRICSQTVVSELRVVELGGTVRDDCNALRRKLDQKRGHEISNTCASAIAPEENRCFHTVGDDFRSIDSVSWQGSVFKPVLLIVGKLYLQEGGSRLTAGEYLPVPLLAMACSLLTGSLGCIMLGIFCISSRRLFGKPSLPGTVIPPLPCAAAQENMANSGATREIFMVFLNRFK